jgi:hypothetical protein
MDLFFAPDTGMFHIGYYCFLVNTTQIKDKPDETSQFQRNKTGDDAYKFFYGAKKVIFDSV